MDKKKNNYCTLYVMRHGQTEWNIKNIIQGHLDSPLTDEGVEQAKQAAVKLKDIHFDAIFSSDSLRAKRTAEIIKMERNLAIQTSHLLRERSFGKYEGMPWEKYREALEESLEKWEKLSKEEQWTQSFDNDNIESNHKLISRFIAFLREIAVAYTGKQVLIVGHGGTLRLLLVHLGWAIEEELPKGSTKNTAFVKLESDGIDFFIKEVDGIEKAVLKN